MPNLEIVKENSAAEVVSHGAVSQLDNVHSMSLMDLAKNKREIRSAIIEGGGELSGDLEDLFEMADLLLSGKIDRVAIFAKEVIPAHIDACKQQIKNMEKLLEKIKDYTLEAIKMSGNEDGRIEGLAWRARMQANPPAIIIQDENAVPMLFKRVRVSIEDVFDAGDVTRRTYWETIIKEKQPRSGDVLLEASKEDLKAALFTKEDGRVVRTATKIDGVTTQQDHHVRFEAGRAKASKYPTKRLKKVKEIEEKQDE